MVSVAIENKNYELRSKTTTAIINKTNPEMRRNTFFVESYKYFLKPNFDHPAQYIK